MSTGTIRISRRTPSSSKSRRSRGPWVARALVQPAVIGIFHRLGIVSGARLSVILRFGRSTAHLVLGRLHRDGAVRVEAKKPGHPFGVGRPTTDYRLNAKRGSFLGVSLMADGVAWALLSFDNVLIDSGKVEKGAGLQGLDSFMNWMRSTFGANSEIAKKHPRILCATIAMDGAPVADDPSLVESFDMKWGAHIPLSELSSAALDGVPVAVMPVATSAAIRESLGENMDPVPTLFIQAHRDFRCSSGFAIGGRRLCGTHKRSGMITAIAEKRTAHLASMNPAAARALEGLSWPELSKRAASGDAGARELDGVLADQLAASIRSLAEFLDPGRVVLGANDDAFGDALHAAVTKRLGKGLVVEASADKAMAYARGAALLPIAAAVTRGIDLELGSHRADRIDWMPPVPLDTMPD